MHTKTVQVRTFPEIESEREDGAQMDGEKQDSFTLPEQQQQHSADSRVRKAHMLQAVVMLEGILDPWRERAQSVTLRTDVLSTASSPAAAAAAAAVHFTSIYGHIYTAAHSFSTLLRTPVCSKF